MTPDPETVEEARAALRRAETALQYAVDRERDMRTVEHARLAELAHEIKTPLNAMLGYTSMMSEQVPGDMGDPRYAGYARTIHDAALHLQDICDRILGHHRDADDGPMDIVDVDVDVRDLAARVVRLFARMAEERGVSLTAAIPDTFPNLRTDSKRLNQILMNLVSNAIKFTPSGGSVSIEAEFDTASGAMIFVVADTGQGMSASRMKTGVQPFRPDNQASLHGDEGAGLGLGIVDQLTRQLRGELRLVSEKGLGTVASVCLPLDYAGAAKDATHADLPPDMVDAKSPPSIFSLHLQTG